MIKISVMCPNREGARFDHAYAESVEAFQKGFGPHMKGLMGDIPNYTDIAPVMQISEVVVGQ